MTYDEAKEQIERTLYGDGPRVLPVETGECLSVNDGLKLWWDGLKSRVEAARAYKDN